MLAFNQSIIVLVIVGLLSTFQNQSKLTKSRLIQLTAGYRIQYMS